jgi:hypothetical protein
MLPEDGRWTAETCRSDTMFTKAVLIINMCISQFLCESVILVHGHEEDKACGICSVMCVRVHVTPP